MTNKQEIATTQHLVYNRNKTIVAGQTSHHIKLNPAKKMSNK